MEGGGERGKCGEVEGGGRKCGEVQGRGREMEYTE